MARSGGKTAGGKTAGGRKPGSSTKKGGAAGARRSKPGRRFIARRSGIHGRGVFATAKIGKGERIIEYVGERITHKTTSPDTSSGWRAASSYSRSSGACASPPT